MKDDNLYIDQILDATRKIDSYIAGFDQSKFLLDEKTQSAVILQLMLIGETSKKLSQEIRSKINLPWKQIIGFRDMAIHDYIALNLDSIWNTVQNDVPALKKELLNTKQPLF